MRKETLIAIILGIAAGIGIAFFLVRQSGNSPKNNDVILGEITPTVAIDTSEIEPLIIQAPESGIVTEGETLELTIAAPKESLVVIQTLIQEITIQNSDRSFTQEINLVPGENVIKITSYNDKNVDTRSLVVYSMTSSLGSSDAKDEATVDEKATDEKVTKEESTIESLKNKIEKKVDELNQGNKNVIVGTIKEIKDDTIIVTSETDEEYTVAVDDTITEIYEVTVDEKESLDFADLEKNDRLVISGPSIEQQISANIIYVQEEYILAQGLIVSTDSSAFTIDVVTNEKDQYTLDVEDDTVQRIMNIESLELAKAGFTKIKNGDTIHFSIAKPSGTSTKASALRTMIIPQEYFTQEKESDK